MFKKGTRTIIRSHKWTKHSNQTQFFKRIRDEIHLGLKDITLAAKELPEEQLGEIFTVEKIVPLLRTLLEPRSKRVILINERMAFEVANKLIRELPNDLVNSLGGDIGKTWTYANLLAQYADKPLLGKNISIQS